MRLPWHSSQLLSYLFSSSLLSFSDGLAAFRAFLRTEFSEENLEFWLACEEYKKIKSQSKMASKAKKVFAEYIAIQSCKEVSAGDHISLRPPKKENAFSHVFFLKSLISHSSHLFFYFLPPFLCR